MIKIPLVLFGLIIISHFARGQTRQENIIYIVDSIPIIEDPSDEEGTLDSTTIAELVVMTNKDSLAKWGYPHMDKAIFIFTKSYMSRPDDQKRTATTKRMTRRNEKWYSKDSALPFSGRFIDYYINGKRQGEGVLKEGKLNGLHTLYYLNGQLSLQRNYENGIPNGEEKEFYADGSLSQKGDFKDGKEDGVWEMYYPNGQAKRHIVFENGSMVGESLTYYSSGRIRTRELVKDGKAIPDPGLEKIVKLYHKGSDAQKDGDQKLAARYFSKCLEMDSLYAEAWFGRGTARMDDRQFDAAILDFDRALTLDPYFKEALADRAFSRIQKFRPTRTISSSEEVTILGVMDNQPIPEQETVKICADLKKALLLEPHLRMLKEASTKYCPLTTGQ